MPPLDNHLELNEVHFGEIDTGLNAWLHGAGQTFDHGMDIAAKATYEIGAGLTTVAKGATTGLFNLAAPDISAPKIGFVPTVSHNHYTA